MTRTLLSALTAIALLSAAVPAAAEDDLSDTIQAIIKRDRGLACVDSEGSIHVGCFTAYTDYLDRLRSIQIKHLDGRLEASARKGKKARKILKAAATTAEHDMGSLIDSINESAKKYKIYN